MHHTVRADPEDEGAASFFCGLGYAAELSCCWRHIPLAAKDGLNWDNPASQADRDARTAHPEAQVRIEVRPVLESPQPSAPDDVLEVGAIVIDGLTVLDKAAFAPVDAPFVGRPLDRGELVQLADAVAARLRREDYVLATAWMPEQTFVGQMLRVRVDKGRIDAVRLEGTQDDAVRH